MDIDRFKQKPILGILRGIDLDIVEPLVETMVAAGLETVEVTMNTPHALEIIQTMKTIAKNRLMIGAGTVLSIDQVRASTKAGATFMVSPVLIPDVVGYCTNKSIPVFPGAATPHEIFSAWRSGATMVKVFPAKFLGPSYIREIKAPLEFIDLMACGGVNDKSISKYFKSGVSAVAFGSSIFKKDLLLKYNFSQIGANIKRLIAHMPS
ncbi:MAG: bifunctional 4-hydroxy-2-oxoglutarate aldolase/2-dehydro-3-deoxy-phosphogluconate aldolase [Elusimicrobia bacterium]|nr:bifunctional 4-hydroxy-2-oxoglutarate aldolase/2-dehydro-3-deoxy-phosphogluconate aldolase [Elusimicrobiota bacterium]MBD3411511.1 bifunctional 4-hydroxy-2-oxoglutarate aldolase/2-dehydro-3-deoxy-phosphogluconate aldolase [Elusimicrobiota bacterium]